ncbi:MULTISPECIES: hypothetical protein [Methylobacterium]|jgi:hypothetical protein|uniref:Uncharacterized protein n=1 Tax=Methylobacterium bullatum TaxID=570505 RepID=A0A679JTX2_9HYPH|nr:MULTISPECIES: hypothetical protein [unclassified Methylobacterium]KQP52125.1 hypothetical protein ASF34_18360 [Methylobacterium sp. Leaf106]TXN33163.1 hypothetical protein FV220_03705 [Methylobacterium sp. WL19]CAA2139213.1 hypothetical protein MBLL_01513 [Methylobacterium bullatum]
MNRIIIKIGRPIAFAVIAFVSSYYLFGSAFIALALSLIPLLLGGLGVFESFSYTVAALIFVAAVIWAVVPAGTKEFVKQHYDAAVKEFVAGMPDTKKTD